METNSTAYYYPANLSRMATGSPLGGARDNVSFWEWAESLVRNRSGAQDSDSLGTVLQAMKVYYTPSVVVFGLVGNTLIQFTLLWTRLRYLSCTHYLSAVMMVNTLYMMALLAQWLKLFGIDLYNTPALCQFVSFINSLCVFLSVWFVVGFAVDRYVISAYPAVSPILCTTLRAKVVIIAILLVGFVVYVNISLTVGVISLKGRLRCSPLPMFLHDLRVLTIIDMIVNILLPYLAVLYIDISLMWYWCRAEHRPLDSDECPGVEPMPTPTENSDASPGSASRRDTAWQVELIQRNRSYANQMQAPMRRFAVVFLTHFLATHLPSEAFRLIHTARGMFNPLYDISRSVYYCQVMAQHLYNTSMATHIVVFSLFHGDFRTQLGRFSSACTRVVSRCLRPAKDELRWTDLPALSDDRVTNSVNSSTLSTSITCL